MSEPEKIIFRRMLEMFRDHLANAGCNDLDPDLFAGLTTAQLAVLQVDFNAWDRRANPDGYEPRAMEFAPDFLWLAFLESRL